MNKTKIVQPVIMTLMIYLIFTADLLWYFGGNITCLVDVGETFAIPAGLPPNFCLHSNSNGFDGQFYYRFALDPFSNQVEAHGIRLEWPAYRYQRILYPLTAWALSLGSAPALPYVMVLVNLAGVCALTALAAVYAQAHERNPHWALLVSLYVGFLVIYAHDLPEIMQAVFLLAAYLAAGTRPLGIGQRPRLTALLLTLAVLTRETALIDAGAVLIIAFWQRWPRRWLYFAPFAVYMVWRQVVSWFWNGMPGELFSYNFGLPFAGLAQAVQKALSTGDWLGLAQLVIFVLCGLLFLWAWVKTSLPRLRGQPLSAQPPAAQPPAAPPPAAPPLVRLAWLFYSGMAVLLTQHVYGDFISYIRVLCIWYLLGCLMLIPLLGVRTARSSPVPHAAAG